MPNFHSFGVVLLHKLCLYHLTCLIHWKSCIKVWPNHDDRHWPKCCGIDKVILILNMTPSKCSWEHSYLCIVLCRMLCWSIIQVWSVFVLRSIQFLEYSSSYISKLEVCHQSISVHIKEGAHAHLRYCLEQMLSMPLPCPLNFTISLCFGWLPPAVTCNGWTWELFPEPQKITLPKWAGQEYWGISTSWEQPSPVTNELWKINISAPSSLKWNNCETCAFYYFPEFPPHY